LSDEELEIKGFIVLMLFLLIIYYVNDFIKNIPKYLPIIIGGVVVIGVAAFGYYWFNQTDESLINNIETHETTFKQHISNNQDTENNSMISSVRDALQKFHPISNTKNYNEKSLEIQLYQYLNVLFGDFNVQYQVTGKTGRIDILIDDDIAIELKIFYSPKQLKQAMYQFYDYADEYSKLFVVIHDRYRKLKPNLIIKLRKDLEKWTKENIEFIVIR